MLARLHFIADHKAGDSVARTLSVLDAVLGAGVPLVQLRAKGCPDREFYELALRPPGGAGRRGRGSSSTTVWTSRSPWQPMGAPWAGGPAHRPGVPAARPLGGPGRASVYTTAEAKEAVAAGATYLGVGPCYPTSTKPGLPATIGPAAWRPSLMRSACLSWRSGGSRRTMSQSCLQRARTVLQS